MIILRILILILVATFFVGCATPSPPKLQENGFEKKDLTELMEGRRVSIKGTSTSNPLYPEIGDSVNKDYCANIRDKRIFENSISSWAPKQVEWEQRNSNDVYISYAWTCTEHYTNGVGGNAFFTLISLGAIPALYDFELNLNVRIFNSNNKEIFKGNYESHESTRISEWVNGSNQQIKAYFEYGAAVLLDKFTKDLDRDGALDK